MIAVVCLSLLSLLLPAQLQAYNPTASSHQLQKRLIGGCTTVTPGQVKNCLQQNDPATYQLCKCCKDETATIQCISTKTACQPSNQNPYWKGSWDCPVNDCSSVPSNPSNDAVVKCIRNSGDAALIKRCGPCLTDYSAKQCLATSTNYCPSKEPQPGDHGPRLGDCSSLHPPGAVLQCIRDSGDKNLISRCGSCPDDDSARLCYNNKQSCPALAPRTLLGGDCSTRYPSSAVLACIQKSGDSSLIKRCGSCPNYGDVPALCVNHKATCPTQPPPGTPDCAHLPPGSSTLKCIRDSGNETLIQRCGSCKSDDYARFCLTGKVVC
ncbi:hypothetical protein PGT21_015135 [Puccinia graminis f. sp. tritici]|uniref:Uncharacterized protein n=1 Tax=Puccinia graminis f. sp. tritici TaxID=56615 RepID=A0A5B0S4K3_PUCGR|nr:hypothetical protein PGT21_015135 [Puccinia graminis f. sp. tritici]KAA1132043.1 hypothetical protein PGTUg99_036351 [Puccinia graminis f. sp. tritici]